MINDHNYDICIINMHYDILYIVTEQVGFFLCIIVLSVQSTYPHDYNMGNY